MKIGWRTITVGFVIAAILYGIGFAADMSEGSTPAQAAVNAAILMVLTVASAALLISAANWASKDSDPK